MDTVLHVWVIFCFGLAIICWGYAIFVTPNKSIERIDMKLTALWMLALAIISKIPF